MPAPAQKKVSVTYRVEPGCLGPEGACFVSDFCRFAEQKMDTFESDAIAWHIIPREDKSQAELQYSMANKRLSRQQATIVLELLKKDIDELEEHLIEHFYHLIEEYMGR